MYLAASTRPDGAVISPGACHVYAYVCMSSMWVPFHHHRVGDRVGNDYPQHSHKESGGQEEGGGRAEVGEAEDGGGIK